MKKCLLFAALLFSIGVIAADVQLKSFDQSKAYERYLFALKGSTAKGTVADGVFKAEIVTNTLNRANAIQFWNIYQDGFKAGVKYKVEATIKSDKAVAIEAHVLQNGKPYKMVKSKKLNLAANENVNVVLEFSPKEDISSEQRTPCFFLGNAEAGTVFEISNVKVSEVK